MPADFRRARMYVVTATLVDRTSQALGQRVLTLAWVVGRTHRHARRRLLPEDRVGDVGGHRADLGERRR